MVVKVSSGERNMGSVVGARPIRQISVGDLNEEKSGFFTYTYSKKVLLSDTSFFIRFSWLVAGRIECIVLETSSCNRCKTRE